MKMSMLTGLRPGQLGRIIAIEGGWGIRQRLSLRGISEGTIVRMISSQHGPTVVEVDRNIVALGRGMAQKIRVMGGE